MESAYLKGNKLKKSKRKNKKRAAPAAWGGAAAEGGVSDRLQCYFCKNI